MFIIMGVYCWEMSLERDASIEADSWLHFLVGLFCRFPGRVRVFDRADRVYCAGVLHAHVEDWLVADCYLG